MPKNTVHINKAIKAVKTQIEAASAALSPKKKGEVADVDTAKGSLIQALEAVEKLTADYKIRRHGYTTKIAKLREEVAELHEPKKAPIPPPPPFIALHKEVVKSSDALGKLETKLEHATEKKGAGDAPAPSELLEQIRNFRGTLKKVEDSVAVDPKGVKKPDENTLLGALQKAMAGRYQAIHGELDDLEEMHGWDDET